MSFSEWIRSTGDSLQVVLFFAGFAVMALCERVWRARPADERGGRWRANLGLTAANLVVLGALPTSFVAAAAWAQLRGLGLLNQAPLPMLFAAGATLLLRGFLSFATHYLNHRVPWLWRVHRVHHLDTEMDVSTTVRFHPLELPIGLAMGLPFVVGLGLEPWALALYELLDVVVTLFSHADVELPEAVDRWLRPLVVTPNLHRIHHSAWQPETDSNFGAVFPVWDILLGTYRPHPREAHATMRLGLEEPRGGETRSLAFLLASPFRALPGANTPPGPTDLAGAGRRGGREEHDRTTAGPDLGVGA